MNARSGGGSSSDLEDLVIIGVDPGRSKCGLAAVERSGRVLARTIVPVADTADTVRRLAEHRPTIILVGNGTGSQHVCDALRAAGLSFEQVDEKGTSEAARKRYLQDHPPRGWRLLIPPGLRHPHEPYDDYVALILAEARIKQLNRLTNER